MHLKISTLTLNDVALPSGGALRTPSPQEVCDAIVLLWKEEPDTESAPLGELYGKMRDRCPQWDLSERQFETLLLEQHLYATDDSQLPVYAAEISCPSVDSIVKDHRDKNTKRAWESISVRDVMEASEESIPTMGRGMFSQRDFNAGAMILQEDEPICIIPPMDKLTLAAKGKTCTLCGNSLTSISSHFIMVNGLDCNDCSAVWCSKKCKTRDVIHGPLRHNKGNKSKLVRSANWTKFESFCKENVFEAAYSLGIIFAKILLNNNTSKDIRQKFQSLCQVSQRVRIDHGDSMNVGGTLDASTGAITTTDPEPIWLEAYELLIATFPILVDEIDMETFLMHIGKFNINKRSNQIYYLTSFINHSCEPNVRFEVDSHLQLTLYARKAIKKGEQLFITYVNPLHGVKLRRRELRVNYGFLCDCDRCQRELKIQIKIKQPANKQENLAIVPSNGQGRRKSSMRNKRPDLQELLKNGKEFELEVPDVIGIGRRRRTSVRFDGNVSLAIEE